MAGEFKVIVRGVTRLEQLDLEDARGADVEFDEEEPAPDEHGEFLTAAAVVALSALAIKALAMWLAKNRSRNGTVEEEVTLELPDGTKFSRRLRVTSASAAHLPDGVASTDLMKQQA